MHNLPKEDQALVTSFVHTTHEPTNKAGYYVCKECGSQRRYGVNL